MSEYKLIALRFDQIIKRSPDGRPVEVIKHRFGSIVTDLDEVEAERLLKAGAIVPTEDDEDVDEVPEQTEAERQAALDAQRVAEEAAKLKAASGSAGQRPKAAATEAAWAAYAHKRGVATDGLNKDQLIAAVDKLDQK